MRKIFTPMMALAIATASGAATAAEAPFIKKTPANVAMETPLLRSDVLSDLPLITETPEGELISYSKNAVYFGMDFYGQMYSSADFGRIANVVETKDGKIYLKNPFCGLDTNSWLEGTLEGDKATVSFPQKIYSETYVDWEADPEGSVTKTNNFYAFKLLYSTDGETSKMELDLNNPTISFSKTDNGYEMDGDAFIGLMMENVAIDETTGESKSSITWARYADSGISLSKVTDTPNAIPDGVATEKWIMASDGMVCFVNVGFDKDDVYIQGLLSSMPEGVVIGKIDGDKVTFSGVQYMGEDTKLNHFAYFIPADVTMNEDPEIFEPYIFSATESVSFDYDREEGVIYASDEIGMATSSIPQSVFLLEGYYAPEFRWQDFKSPMTPDNPEVMSYEYYDDLGFGGLQYNIPNWSTDGRVMLASNLFYSFYVDDQVLTLYPDEYPDLTEPTTVLPAEYEDSYIYFWGDFYEAVIFPSGFDRIGVQSFYVNEDGSKNYSDIVYNDGTVTSAIGNISTEAPAVEYVEYFSIDGRKLQSPEKGTICIKRIHLSDSKTVTSKAIIK